MHSNCENAEVNCKRNSFFFLFLLSVRVNSILSSNIEQLFIFSVIIEKQSKKQKKRGLCFSSWVLSSFVIKIKMKYSKM